MSTRTATAILGLLVVAIIGLVALTPEPEPRAPRPVVNSDVPVVLPEPEAECRAVGTSWNFRVKPTRHPSGAVVVHLQIGEQETTEFLPNYIHHDGWTNTRWVPNDGTGPCKVTQFCYRYNRDRLQKCDELGD